MKRRFTILMAALLALAFTGMAHATNYDYLAQVYKKTVTTTGDVVLTEISSGITFQVLTVNSDTEATITKFGDDAATSVTNPVTTTNFAAATVCNGVIKFRSTASSHDLIAVDTAGGYSVVVEDFTPNMHKVVIDETPNITHSGLIWYSIATTGEQDTGIDFQYDTFIHDVRVEPVTACAGCTLDVGLLSSETSGNADGLRDGVSEATAGYVADTGVITSGSTEDYTPVTTYGTMLHTAVTGSDADGSAGGNSYIGHIVTGANAKSLTYSHNSAGTGYGYIHFLFTRLR